jgi:hypothetical protein
MLTMEFTMVSIFLAPSLISFQHLSFWCPFLDPHLTAHHSNIGVQIIVVFELGTSTLAVSSASTKLDSAIDIKLHLRVAEEVQ